MAYSSEPYMVSREKAEAIKRRETKRKKRLETVIKAFNEMKNRNKDKKDEAD